MSVESGCRELLGPRLTPGRHTPASGGAARASPAELDLIVLRSKQGLRALKAYLLSPDRTHAVVALTRSLDTDGPALAPTDVRASAGPGIKIYYIPGEFLLRRLGGVLGGKLALPRGAVRVWWPGLSVRSDPADHPLVLALEGEDGRELLGEFARQFDLSRPHVRREIKLIEDARALSENELAQARERIRSTEKRLRDTQVERRGAATRAQSARDRLGAAMGELSESSCEEALHALISREWIGALGPADRREHPLGAYVLTAQFVAMVERQADLPRERLAWVCAMLACRYAATLPGIAPHPLMTAPGGQQIERADGAKGWRCNVKRNATGGPRLHYWIRADRAIEFASVGNHDELGAK